MGRWKGRQCRAAALGASHTSGWGPPRLATNPTTPCCLSGFRFWAGLVFLACGPRRSRAICPPGLPSRPTHPCASSDDPTKTFGSVGWKRVPRKGFHLSRFAKKSLVVWVTRSLLPSPQGLQCVKCVTVTENACLKVNVFRFR